MWRLACGPSAARCWLPTLRHVLTATATCSPASANYAAAAPASSEQRSSKEQLGAVAAALQHQQPPQLLALQQTTQCSAIQRSLAYSTHYKPEQHSHAPPRHPDSRILPQLPYLLQSSRGHTSRARALRRSIQVGGAVDNDGIREEEHQGYASEQSHEVTKHRKNRAQVQQPGRQQQQRREQLYQGQGYKQQQQRQPQQQQWYDADSMSDSIVQRSSWPVRPRQQQQQQWDHQQQQQPGWYEADLDHRDRDQPRSSRGKKFSWQQQQQHYDKDPSHSTDSNGYGSSSKSSWQPGRVSHRQHLPDKQGFGNPRRQQQQQQQWQGPGQAWGHDSGNRSSRYRAAAADTTTSSSNDEISNAAAAAAAALGQHQPATPPSLAAAAAARASILDPPALTTALGNTQTLAELQQLLSEHNDHLQQINICAAFKAVVRLAKPASRGGSSDSSSQPGGAALAIMRQLSSKMQAQIKTARPWDLAQAAWACSKLNHRDQGFLTSVAQQTIRKAAILLPQDIAQIASAYARLKFKNKPLLQLLQQQTLVKADSFEPWSLIHTAWSLEMLGAPASYMLELLTVISKQFEFKQIQKLQPLDVATLLWLMASHEFYNQELLNPIGEVLAAQIASYPAAAAAQALISIAALGFYDRDLAAAAATAVQQQMQQQRQYTPKQLAQITFALVKLGHASPEFLAAAAAAFVSSSSGSYSPRFLCMICWAMIMGGYRSEGFTEILVKECHSQLPEFTADQIASIVRGLFRSPGWSDHTQITDLISAAADQLPQQLPSMQTAVLGRLILSLCKEQRHSQIRYTQQQQQQPGPGSSSSGGEQQQQGELLLLLQHCAQEWQQRQQQGISIKEVEDVHAALAAAGLHDLAAASVKTKGQLPTNDIEPPQLSPPQDQQGLQQQQQQQQQQEEEDEELSASTRQQKQTGQQDAAGNNAQPGSWLDSFVATADEK